MPAGGTGYIGSLVVEHLLRSVPDVAKIYLLIRSKGGKPAQARLDRLLNSGLFHMVRDDAVLRLKVGRGAYDNSRLRVTLYYDNVMLLWNHRLLPEHCQGCIWAH